MLSLSLCVITSLFDLINTSTHPVEAFSAECQDVCGEDGRKRSRNRRKRKLNCTLNLANTCVLIATSICRNICQSHVIRNCPSSQCAVLSFNVPNVDAILDYFLCVICMLLLTQSNIDLLNLIKIIQQVFR